MARLRDRSDRRHADRQMLAFDKTGTATAIAYLLRRHPNVWPYRRGRIVRTPQSLYWRPLVRRWKRTDLTGAVVVAAARPELFWSWMWWAQGVHLTIEPGGSGIDAVAVPAAELDIVRCLFGDAWTVDAVTTLRLSESTT